MATAQGLIRQSIKTNAQRQARKVKIQRGLTKIHKALTRPYRHIRVGAKMVGRAVAHSFRDVGNDVSKALTRGSKQRPIRAKVVPRASGYLPSSTTTKAPPKIPRRVVAKAKALSPQRLRTRIVHKGKMV